MSSLQQFLEKIDEDTVSKFDSIADALMNNYRIEKGSKKYEIVEIEFYLYSKWCKDYITYPRNTEAGRWFFHSSGVDLTFKSEKVTKVEENGKITYEISNDSCLGGILIRGIYDIDKDKYIFGPQKCVDELWDELDAFGENNSMDDYPVLVKHATNGRKLLKCKRCINIDKRIEKITKWAQRLGQTLNEEEAREYDDKLFENEGSYLFRYFNLKPEEDPCKYTKIPSQARPVKTFSV